MDLIQHLAQTKATFLHPLGKEGTDLLLNNISIKSGQRILEIGCGNGATAEKILQKIEVDYHAVEKSEEMMKGIRDRNIIPENNLFLISDNKLPFQNDYFDVIIAESVLAIIEGEELSKMVEEIYRVLKPTGTFISNDAIWKPDTTKDIILKINAQSKTNFDLIQSNDLYCYKEDWIRLFTSNGFINIEAIKLMPKPPKNRAIQRFNLKKINSLLTTPKLFINEVRYKSNLKKMYEYGNYIEAYIFKMVK